MDFDARLNRILVACLADAIVARLRARARCAVLVGADGDLGRDAALGQLRALRDAGWTFVRIGDDAAFADLADATAETLVARAALVLVPTLSVSLAAKLALGIADDPASKLLAAALQRGRRVVAARDGACPMARERGARGDRPSAAYAAMMSAHLATLASYGIDLCWSSRLAETVLRARTPPDAAATPKHTSSVFGWSEARACAAPQLTLDRTVLVTPLAAEELSARGVRLLRE